MAFGASMLTNTLTLVGSTISSSFILNSKTIISSTQNALHSTYHIVNRNALQKDTYVGVMLTINGHDTTEPIGI